MITSILTIFFGKNAYQNVPKFTGHKCMFFVALFSEKLFYLCAIILAVKNAINRRVLIPSQIRPALKKRKAIQKTPPQYKLPLAVLLEVAGCQKWEKPNIVRKKTGIGYSPLKMLCKLRTVIYRFLTLQIQGCGP